MRVGVGVGVGGWATPLIYYIFREIFCRNTLFMFSKGTPSKFPVNHEVPNSATCAVSFSATYIFFFLVVQGKWRKYIIRWSLNIGNYALQCEVIPKVRQRVVNV